MSLPEKGENYINRSLEKDQSVLASSGVITFAPLSNLAQYPEPGGVLMCCITLLVG